jgi:tRNA(Arg) A34 adenosine deaminase TadA
MEEHDQKHLRAAIALARAAGARGDGPYGAVLVDPEGVVVLEGQNTTVTERDCTGHAETNVVRAAGRRFTPEQLAGYTLYASAEPCAMCAAAIYLSGVGRVVFAASAAGMAAATGQPRELALDCRDVLAHGRRLVKVAGPLLEEEALRAVLGE